MDTATLLEFVHGAQVENAASSQIIKAARHLPRVDNRQRKDLIGSPHLIHGDETCDAHTVQVAKYRLVAQIHHRNSKVTFSILQEFNRSGRARMRQFWNYF